MSGWVKPAIQVLQSGCGGCLPVVTREEEAPTPPSEEVRFLVAHPQCWSVSLEKFVGVFGGCSGAGGQTPRPLGDGVPGNASSLQFHERQTATTPSVSVEPSKGAGVVRLLATGTDPEVREVAITPAVRTSHICFDHVDLVEVFKPRPSVMVSVPKF